MMNRAHLVAINQETLMIDSRCSFEKESIELICMTLSMVLYVMVNEVVSRHTCVCGPLT